ncbi:MAG: hypothetical protein ACYC3L_09030 [Gemmatimonadaceae bacterium]
MLRGVAESADALARLDTVVGSAPAGIGSLLMLRTAHEIASRVGAAVPVDGDFVSLLGWWYAAESREFVPLYAALRDIALALDSAAGKARGGRVLTPLFLEEINADVQGGGVSPAMGALFQRARAEGWPPLTLLTALCTGAFEMDDTLTAMIARAVVPVAGALTTDAYIGPLVAADPAEVLHAMAGAARRRLQAVRDYLRAADEVRACTAGFGRGAPTARALVDLLVGAPAMTVQGASAAIGVSVPSVGAAVQRLLEAGVVREITGRGRDRVFVYEPALALAG